jgi:LysR family transcriptional regulator for metE and metH
MLVTPDPLFKPGLRFTSVFDYEQVLVVGPGHPLRSAEYVEPHEIAEETLITYPVATDRLDIYTQFLMPAGITPKRHMPIETTDIMLLMVAHGRGVAALPRWLVDENAATFDIRPIRLGRDGVAKQIFLGLREADAEIDYIRAFIDLASTRQPAGLKRKSAGSRGS